MKTILTIICLISMLLTTTPSFAVECPKTRAEQKKWEEKYDIKTGKKKVLAFIFNYYMDKYGYAPVRCYGLELDEKGESLVFYANGGFSGPDDDNPYAIKMRRPAVFQMFIPETERVE